MSSLSTNHRMDADLEVAGNITDSLESWSGIGGIGTRGRASPGGDGTQSSSGVPDTFAGSSGIYKIEYPVLYARVAQER